MRIGPPSLALVAILSLPAMWGASSLHAQEKQNPEQQTTSQEATLAREVQVIREYDARMQETVYWALGVVVVVLILLGGFSWYTNFRVYERDLNNLRGEIAIAVERTGLSLKEELSKVVISSTQKLSEVQDSFASRTTKEINEIEERLSDRVTKSDFTHFQRDFLELKIELFEKTEAVPFVILREYVNLLELGVELNWDHTMASALDKIERFLKNGTKLYERQIEQLVRSLDRLPKHLVPKGEKVRPLIADALF